MTKEESRFAALPEDGNGYLSFVALSDDNAEILLNGEQGYKVKIPVKIKAKRDAEDKRKIIEGAIYDGCSIFKIDSISADNVTRAAKEVIGQLYERARV